MATYEYLYAQPTVTFYTVNGSYPVVARSSSHNVPSESYNYFNAGLLSFQTQNDQQQNKPTGTVILDDSEDWASLLVPNDYVRIDMQYRSNAFSDEADQIVNTTLFCGIISDIKKQFDGSSNTRSYIITLGGVAQILDNINLSTFSEITSNVPNYVLLPDDEKTGIRFDQRTSANIIKQILNRFVTGTNDFVAYNYQDQNSTNYSTQQIVNWSDDTIIENQDESFQNSAYNQFSNYNGSILQMIKDVSAPPFNEIYWTHEEGIATLHYRPTPFDQAPWNALERIQISTDDVISENLDVSSQDQYSIFKLLAQSEIANSTVTGWGGYLAPLTNKELIRRYGYKTMEVRADYFNGNNEENSSNLTNSPASGNQNLSSQAQAYSSQVEKACNNDNCPDLYPYAMAIIQLELNSGASSTDPANAASHGGGNISNSTSSINYLVGKLKSYDDKASDDGIDDKLVDVQCYNFGSGFIDYLNSVGDKSMSLTASENYSKRIAKANGNSNLTTVGYNTAVSQSYGRNYLYKNGGNYYYAYEAKQYLGNTQSSSSNITSNSNASNTTVSEEQARQSYPPYDSIEDVFAVAQGDSVSSKATIPAKYGGVANYDQTINYLQKYSDRSAFIAHETSLGISSSNASQIYSQYHTSRYSGATNKMSRGRYLDIIAPNYLPTSSNISKDSQYLKSKASIKANPKKAAMELMQELNYTIGSKQAYEIIETWLNNGGHITESQYNSILSKYPYNETEDGVNPMSDEGSFNSVAYLFLMYTRKLYNWYADNSKFHNGDITINGTSGIEFGKRLVIYDSNDGVYWEYYIESVSHDFSIESGWTTVVGVTRGVPLNSLDDQRRFEKPYSFSAYAPEPFTGGYFGEINLRDAIEAANADDDSSSSSGSANSGGSDDFSDGSSTANKIASYALSLATHGSSYTQNAYWRSKDLFTQSDPLRGDCSSFVYWCYKHAGVDISVGGNYTTSSFPSSSKLKTVYGSNSNKKVAYNHIHVGDIIYFYNGGHVGIAYNHGVVAFNTSTGITKFSIGSGTWWNEFTGKVLRLR